MLGGLTALAVPVIIHLLLKRKKQRVRFSTIQFFLKQDQHSSQKRKLRNLLLLALRLLIFTLLVLAFARPYLSRTEAAANARKKQQVIFVIDRSASTQAMETDGQRWVRAKDRIQKMLSELIADDRVALVGCASKAEVIAGFAPPAGHSTVLNELLPTFETSNLGEGLRQASKLMVLGDPDIVSTIYVVSDLQRSATQSLASYPVPNGIEVKLLNVGDLLTPNFGIADLQVGVGTEAKPHLVAASFSDEDNAEVALELNIDGKAALSRTVSLPPGSSTNVDLALPALKAGWHDVRVTLRAKDALNADDTRYSALYVPEPTQVVVVETWSGKRVFDEETFFIATALDPSKGATNSVQTTYNVSKVTPEELVRRLSVNEGKSACDLVVLPGLSQVPAGSGRALTAFVPSGGGALFFLGNEISPNRYNSEFRDLLPAQLGAVEMAEEVGASWRISEFDTNTMMFAPFSRPNSGDLRIPEFTKRHVLTSAPGSAQPALFDDGLPLILIRSAGNGRVALVNTSADTAWNDWPKHKTFVPWLHGLGKYLAKKAGQDQIHETNTFVVGDDFEIEMGAAAKKVQFKFQSSGGKEINLMSDDEGRLRDANLTVPGIYSFRDAKRKEVRRLALNTPAQESDLGAISANDFQQQLVRVDEAQPPTLAASLFGSMSNKRNSLASCYSEFYSYFLSRFCWLIERERDDMIWN
ncbi:MAG: VWA domain-containing protein [Verrucomicrobia bacterium]|nr:VWA domain-containing protein [Verrucomicrobiota bacterium]